MTFAPSPNQSAIMTALGNFLASILPAGVLVVQGQDNRVPEPIGADFVIMTPIMRQRLETNVDTYSDCAFIASIAGAAMTMTELLIGSVMVGNVLFGPNVAGGTTIQSQSSGSPGGVGVYALSGSQTVTSEKMASGTEQVLEPQEITVQIDIHSANVADSADMAVTISALFRDDFAVSYFEANFPGIAPLYADDPKQMPFENAEKQYETRWIVDACLQVNQTITVPMQFADELTPTIMDEL